jgi:hypothetical protein
MEKKELKQALASALKQAVENFENLRKAELAGKAKLEQKELKKAAAPTMPGRGDATPTAAGSTGDPVNAGPLEILQHSEKVAKNALPGAGDTTNVGSTVPGMMANAEKIEICPECKGDDDKKKLCKKCSGDKLSKAVPAWVTSTGNEPVLSGGELISKPARSPLPKVMADRPVGESYGAEPAKEGVSPHGSAAFSGAVGKKFDPLGEVSAWVNRTPGEAASAALAQEAHATQPGARTLPSGADVTLHRGLQGARGTWGEEKKIIKDNKLYNKRVGKTAQKGSEELKQSEELININGTHQKDGSDKQERYETPNKQGEKAVLPGDKDSKEVAGNDHKVRNSIPGKGKKVAKSAEKIEKTTDAYANLARMKGDKNGSNSVTTKFGKVADPTKSLVPPTMTPPVPDAAGGLPKPKFQ